MKSTVTSSEMFKYILLFTFLFAAFLALAITYNKVYKLKNESISILEKYEGVSHKSLTIINNYLMNNGYKTKGQCEIGEHGMKSLEDPSLETVSDRNTKYYYCLSDYVVLNDNINRVYYKVKFFFKFNLPFFGDLFRFRITGESKGIQYYDANQRL